MTTYRHSHASTKVATELQLPWPPRLRGVALRDVDQSRRPCSNTQNNRCDVKWFDKNILYSMTWSTSEVLGYKIIHPGIFEERCRSAETAALGRSIKERIGLRIVFAPLFVFTRKVREVYMLNTAQKMGNSKNYIVLHWEGGEERESYYWKSSTVVTASCYDTWCIWTRYSACVVRLTSCCCRVICMRCSSLTSTN